MLCGSSMKITPDHVKDLQSDEEEFRYNIMKNVLTCRADNQIGERPEILHLLGLAFQELL